MRCVCLVLALLLGCGGERVSDTVVVRIEGSAERPLNPGAVRYEPADNVRAARLSAQGALLIERRDRARALRVHVPELCPVSIAAGAQRAPSDAKPVIDLGRDRAPVGFDAAFSISVKHGCPERGRGTIAWRQLEGAALTGLTTAREGFELRARTARFEPQAGPPRAPGIVPFSPRTQGRVVLEALWRAPGAAPIRRTFAITATSRATGLSSVAVSQQIMLAGEGWRVQKAPAQGHAQVHGSGALAMFTPDAPGRWTLAHGAGETLTLQALWHDKTPYDCGRSECHASIAASTLDSPMSAALQRHLAQPEPANVGCMLDCHVLGERGLHDGGFVNVAAQLGFGWHAGTRWDDLPQALRRLGGVRCTACHGPGVLPEPEGRALVLSSDVCATCHDAPPRYVHVEEWRSSKMARADSEPGTRSGVCASCHTTAGYLERVAAPRPKTHALDAGAAPIGIACAACHAPHAAHRGDKLVRSVPAHAIEAELEPRSALCVSCHAPAPEQMLASAPSGALWLDQVRVPAVNGEGWDVLRAEGAHRGVPGGCVGCHGATAEGRVDHAFRVADTTCKSCHAQGVARTDELQQRARALALQLEAACSVVPQAAQPHAAAEPLRCKTPRQARALYAVRLVLEDPAAFVHNAPLARALLQDAEQNAGP